MKHNNAIVDNANQLNMAEDKLATLNEEFEVEQIHKCEYETENVLIQKVYVERAQKRLEDARAERDTVC